jgi:hypothetical protein
LAASLVPLVAGVAQQSFGTGTADQLPRFEQEEQRNAITDVRKGMPPRQLDRATFDQRFKSRFVDPVFASLQKELQALTDAAWDAYDDSRKAPIYLKAGPDFFDPNYDLSVDWLAARRAIQEAQERYDDPTGPCRILIINGSSRTEHTCPGEMSKTWRLVELAQQIVTDTFGFQAEIWI